MLPENSSAWNLLQLKEGHQKATALGKGVVVAVLDTGVDFEHVAWNSMAFVSPQLFHDYVDMDQYPKETGDPTQVGYGHGTGVTGVILQIAPQARILPLRVLDANGQGDTIHLASAIYAAVDGGANVINLSLGTNQRSTILETAIKYAQGKNVTIVASAGNDGVGTLLYPAAFSKDYKNVISVGSVSTALKKSTFSNYSPYLTLTGLGENISTTFPKDRKTTWSGTSFSAPEVSGAIALALSVNVNLTPDKILKHLSDTSTSYAAINSDQKNLLGSGLLNVNKFIDAVGKDL
ncbi:hypothetical protein DC3_46220 [Deinococcus cellulosilyticus NBRC 106333 = KACC 11606]|uniref:Peptidase S8/S53 domain-containing protein n=1 Tax=Deinococcus cellulosilyticus (strain DSM 18568 / NBRC 106333 / KACC 11606 / 5516J-15) TaxID=1223518 RepID=A0A511N8X6_DEIC1|nr:hypothetical protein DC3_46220 [Deinococcus cellulosilyticus NBRC 106333 = KACC 11606]